MELFNSIEATSRRSRIIDGKIANEVSVAASRWEKNKKKFDIFKQKTKSFFMNASITFQTIPDYDKPTNYSLNRSISDVAKVTDELDSRLSEREIGFFDRSKIITNILRAFSMLTFLKLILLCLQINLLKY